MTTMDRKSARVLELVPIGFLGLTHLTRLFAVDD
jgi:hypothetical protein